MAVLLDITVAPAWVSMQTTSNDVHTPDKLNPDIFTDGLEEELGA